MSGDNDPLTTSRSEESEGSRTDESSIQHTTVDTESKKVATTQGGTSNTSFTPKEPKFGGLDMTGQDTLTPWTGGKPKSDWTELETKAPASIQPTQYRPTSISAQCQGS